MYARLLCQPPRGAAREIRLPKLPALLGRGEQVDVRVADRWVSRRHCQIDQRQGVLVVTDLGSTHGTWLNDQRVEEAEIHPGDRLAIGLTTLIARPSQDRQTHGLDWFVFLIGDLAASLLRLARTRVPFRLTVRSPARSHPAATTEPNANSLKDDATCTRGPRL